MDKKIEQIDAFANRCGYFYNAYIKENISANNGYNCRHPEQEQMHFENGKEIGLCYSWSCPCGIEPDEEDFKNPEIDKNGYTDFEEGEFILIDVD